MLDYSLYPETCGDEYRWEKHLDANVQDWQRKVKPGDFFCGDVPHAPVHGRVIDSPNDYEHASEHYRWVHYLDQQGLFDAEDDEDGADYFHIALMLKVLSAAEFDKVAQGRQEESQKKGSQER